MNLEDRAACVERIRHLRAAGDHAGADRLYDEMSRGYWTPAPAAPHGELFARDDPLDASAEVGGGE